MKARQMMATKFRVLLVCLGAGLAALITAGSQAQAPVVGQGRYLGVSEAVENLRFEPLLSGRRAVMGARVVPLGHRPLEQLNQAVPPLNGTQTSSRAMAGSVPLASPELSFEGINGAYNRTVLGYSLVPPDTDGDVGLKHYVQAVNVMFQVYDKVTGATLTPPLKQSQLFASVDPDCPCAKEDKGDPIVLYDSIADRWFLTQFGWEGDDPVPPFYQCVALSLTGDATGAYYLYQFEMPNEKFNDYGKFGVWPDAYYMSDNQFTGFDPDHEEGESLANADDTWGGAGVFALDRAAMLAGATPTYVYFDLQDLDNNLGGMLPSDLDGPPPPSGTPNYYSCFTNTDALRLFEFHVDFQNPAQSTFTERLDSPLAVTLFHYLGAVKDPIPQPGTLQNLDGLADRLMFRLQYRNFGDHETLIANHTVDADGRGVAGVRYYEFRRGLPEGQFTVAQAGTFAPDQHCRWMGSAAMNKDGVLAVGYSVSSAELFPSIRYAARFPTDPPNALPQGEIEIAKGAGSQLDINRWGDYSNLSVDPADDTTFWYTQEYYQVSTRSRDWHTRVARFKIEPVAGGTLTGKITRQLSSNSPISGVQLQVENRMTTTDSVGQYFLVLPAGMHEVFMTHPDYAGIDLPATIAVGATTVLDASMTRAPVGTLDGTVTDASTGLPISKPVVTAALTNYTAIRSVNGSSSGHYSMTLKQGMYNVTFAHTDYNDASATAEVTGSHTTTLNAQLTKASGTISGVVADAQSSAPIQGAQVLAAHTGVSTASTVTDESGTFDLMLDVGPYEVAVLAAGYLSPSATQITVTANETTWVDFELDPISAGTVTPSPETPTPTPAKQLADLNHDGQVNAEDLLLLLGNWRKP